MSSIFPELNYGWMNEQMKTTTKHRLSDENRGGGGKKKTQ